MAASKTLTSTETIDGVREASVAYTLRKVRDAGGDYVIKCYTNGKRYPDGDSFEDDWQAAKDTFAFLTREANGVDAHASEAKGRTAVRLSRTV